MGDVLAQNVSLSLAMRKQRRLVYRDSLCGRWPRLFQKVSVMKKRNQEC